MLVVPIQAKARASGDKGTRGTLPPSSGFLVAGGQRYATTLDRTGGSGGAALHVEAAQVGGDRCSPELPEQCGDLAAVISPVVDHVLQALHEPKGDRLAGQVSVVEGAVEAILGEIVEEGLAILLDGRETVPE